VPQWVQIAGVVIGIPLASIAVWQVWKHRRQIWAWWVARKRLLQVAMIGAVLTAGIVAAGSGLYGYHYVMHDNDFCQSCHVMDVAWNRFQVSAHKTLQCHACHRQPLYASTVELYWWVTERRMAVPAHDKVPTIVCNECHMREGTDSARTLVTLTAGHALHLKSDSSALKNVQCITCHGRDFHLFNPNNATCAQSGCHTNTRINLGAMSRQGFSHCTTCHDFRSRVAPGVTVTQARKQLSPRALDCSACHAMTAKIATFDLAADPHRGNCGSCHDPHTQEKPADAFKSCASAQCHAAADTLTAFHRGLGGHTLDQCGACHQAHSWKVKGTDCLACHKTIYQDRPAAQRAKPVRKTALIGPRRAARAKETPFRFASFTRVIRSRVAAVRIAPQRAATAPPPRDTTFLHSRHKTVECTACHGTGGTHGALKIVAPSGCLGCHHGPAQRAACGACHRTESLGQRAMPVTFRITARRDPVTRPLSFAHAQHPRLDCAKCHGADVKRSVTAACTTCHADHHAADRDCASCHPTARAGHDRAAHEGCTSCHTDASTASMAATRSLCLSCHQEQRNHYPDRDCATCHAVALRGGARGGRSG
jgi:hypothetical protein